MALHPILSKHRSDANPQKALKQRRRAVGLQTLLLCFFTGVAIIPVSFLGTWVYNNALSAREQAVMEKHQLLAKNISSELAVYADDLRLLFESRSQGEPKRFSTEGKMLLQSKQVQMLAFVEKETNLYCMGDESWLPEGGMEALRDERTAAWLRPGKTQISPVKINQHGEPTIYLLRINDIQKLVVAAVSTEHLMQVQERIVFGKSGHAAIVDQDGSVLAHPLSDWERDAKNLGALTPIVLMQSRSKGVTKFYSPALKADMIAGYAVVPRVGWGVMIPQRYSEIQAQALRTKRIALAVSLLGLGLAVTLSWQLTRYILRPIQSVIAAAKALESGQAVPPLNSALKSYRNLPKEFVNLLLAFDQMATEVSAVRTTLEQRVEERTQALAAEVKRRTQLEQQLIQQATHDALTGLPNRRLLTERLQSLIALSQRSGKSFALLFLDLDGFKKVNDSYGHAIGDSLLVQVSQRLQASLRQCDSVFRLGGDEFVVLVERIDAATAREKVSILTRKIIATLCSPFWIQKQAFEIGVSIGIKISQGDWSTTTYEILESADKAMYQAKKKGNCAVIHSESSSNELSSNELSSNEPSNSREPSNVAMNSESTNTSIAVSVEGKYIS